MPPTAAIRGSDRLESRVRLRRADAGRARRWSCWPPLGLAQLGPSTAGRSSATPSSFATIIGASLLVPAIALRAGPGAARGRCGACFGVEGLLAHAHLASAIPRLSISVAALAVSLSMMVAVAVMIGSFRETVVYWVGQTLQADLFVGPGVQPTVGSAQTLSPDGDRRRAQRIPTSRPSTRSATSTSSTSGNLVVLGAGQFDVVRVARRAALQGAGRRTRGAGAGDRHRCGGRLRGVRQPVRRRSPATRCTLPTPAGDRPFRGRRRLLRLRRRSRRDRDGPRHLRPALRRPAADRPGASTCAPAPTPSAVRQRDPRRPATTGSGPSSTPTARCAPRCCASSTAPSPSPTRSSSSPSSSPCSAWRRRCSRWCSSGGASWRCCA